MTLTGFTDDEKRMRLKQQQKDWRDNNKEYLQDQLKQWRANNKERIKIHKTVRKIRLEEYKRKADLYDQLHKPDDQLHTTYTSDHTILAYATSPPERL